MVNLSVDVSSVAIVRFLQGDRRALHRHRGRALARLLYRHAAHRVAALQLCPARIDARPPSGASRRPDGGHDLRGQSRAWCPGWSSRRWSIVAEAATGRPGRRERQDRARAGAGTGDARLGVKGIHIAERDTQRAKVAEADGRLRQHLVGRRLRVGGAAAGRTRLGHPREGPAARRPPPRFRAGLRHLPAAPRCAGTRVRSWTPTAGPQHGFLVTHNESISISDYLHRHRGRQGRLSADLPLCLPAGRRCGALARRDGRPRNGSARSTWTISSNEDEILDGIDELGVLL